MTADPPWDHNIHFHRWILEQVPAGCNVALDVGCGDGLLAGRLGTLAKSVIGVDRSADMIRLARQNVPARNVRFVEGDVLQASLPQAGFDLIAAVAVMHHVPLERGLQRLSDLLRPGGVLAVVGLARKRSPLDYVVGGASVPVAWLAGLRNGTRTSPAPIEEPELSYAEIARTARTLLPGVKIRRRFFFRYTLLWRKPRA